MNKAKAIGIITVFLGLLVHDSLARSVQSDCVVLCAAGVSPLRLGLDCDCFNPDSLPYVKRGVKLPFRYGKRSSLGFPSGLQFLRNTYG